MDTTTYQAKQDARRDRLLRRADRAEHIADARERQHDALLAPIPPGQPILVGHHSERRHRRTLDRAHSAMRKAMDLRAMATRLRERAAAVGTAGISSDDPNAPDAIRATVARLTAQRDRMKAINAAYRKGGVDRVREDFGETHAAAVVKWETTRYSFDTAPFGGWPLTNIGANIRRYEKRLAALEAAAASPARDDVEGTVDGIGYRITEATDDNRLRIYFDAKPTAERRTILKRHGFRWARSVGAWQRQLNDSARYAARTAVA